MTRTECLALLVLVGAAAAVGLSHTRRGAAPADRVVERAAGGAPAPNDPSTRPGARDPGTRGDGAGAAGDASDRLASSGRRQAIGVRPAPRQAEERAAATEWDTSAEPAPPIAVDHSDGAVRERAPAAPGGARASGGADGPTADEPAGAANPDGEVLLSIPLRGAVDPEQGAGPPPQTSGLVTNGGAVEFTEDAQYTLPADGHVNSEAGTISFTVEPHWAGADESNNSLLQIRDENRWENSLGIVKNYNALRYVIRDALGVETNVNVYIDQWQPNEPHVVTATWDSERMTLSIDGEQVGESPLPNRLQFGAATPIHVGSDFPSSSYRGANARISDLTVRSTALAPGAAP